MVSRNELLGQMQRPKTPEELLNELLVLQRGGPHLTTNQKIRLDELEAWHKEYLKSLEPQFRSFVFHPVKGEKIVESREDFEKALSEGWYGTRDELKEAVANMATAEGRQKRIEQEFIEEIKEDLSIDREKYLILLKRSLNKDSGTKMLYYYSTDELIEAHMRLGIDFDQSVLNLGGKARIELYKNLRNYIELNT